MDILENVKEFLCVLLMNVIHLEAHLKVKLHDLILKRKTLKHFSIVLVWLHNDKVGKKSLKILQIDKEIFPLK